MVSKKQVTTIVWGAILIWASLMILNGVPFSQSWFSPISTSIGVLVFLISIYEKWIWRWSLFHPLVVSTPVLQGTWKGELRSSYTDPKTGERYLPIEAYLVVKQTYSTISLKLMTNESSSESISNILQQKDDGRYTLAGIYCNTPSAMVRDRSPMHHGSVLFSVIDEKVPLLDGEYWTDRLTKGSIRFDRHMTEQFQDFRTAAKEFNKLPGDDKVPNSSVS